MPPALRTHRDPTGADTPQASAASSLDNPPAIFVQTDARAHAEPAAAQATASAASPSPLQPNPVVVPSTPPCSRCCDDQLNPPFASQLEWMKRLADDPREPWTSKGLAVRAFEDRDLSLVERDLAIT